MLISLMSSEIWDDISASFENEKVDMVTFILIAVSEWEQANRPNFQNSPLGYFLDKMKWTGQSDWRNIPQTLVIMIIEIN